MNGIELGVFSQRIAAICEEMGAVLRGAAFSPNIKDRLDFSCAVFDAQGLLCAQAAHIPVHLGSMAYAMADIVGAVEWQPGDILALNDPFLGGTHLPDVTLVTPVFSSLTDIPVLDGFVVNRAHHANIGGHTPGSMPISTHLDQEGVVIPPTFIERAGQINELFFSSLTEDTGATATGGDFAAQMSANRVGAQRLSSLIGSMGGRAYQSALKELNHYGSTIAAKTIAAIPDGDYVFRDFLDDDGQGEENILIQACLSVKGEQVAIDFTGTHRQVVGNINCPLSVAAAAVYYAFRCLMPSYTPACQGVFDPIVISAPEGCLLNARRPAAVAAGNVETSTRVVDVILGCLAQAIPEQIPAASHGSMNNVAMGAMATDGQLGWDYYETIAGGMGASAEGHGLHAVQTHMTNTLNTPIESLESHYPLRITRYGVRNGSGGRGRHCGGDGLVREFQFLQATHVTLLTERRLQQPWGLEAGMPGGVGKNQLNGSPLAGKCEFTAHPGDRLTISTPGGGGYGVTRKEDSRS